MLEKILLVLLIVINLAVFAMYGIDKYKAVKGKWRIPEKVLLLAALCGGSAGALLGMQIFHHKTRHWKFLVGVPLCFVLHIGLGVLYWWFFIL